MKDRKNRFIIFYVFNIALLLLILVLAIPFSNFLSKLNFDNNEYVINQVVINPEKKSEEILDRKLLVNLVARVDQSLNWDISTIEDKVEIRIGEQKTITYQGINLSDKEITSTAIFVASPESISPYLIKTECFCFKEQTLKPGESKLFTMVFYIDPSLDSDSNFNNLKELLFTYEFSEYKS